MPHRAVTMSERNLTWVGLTLEVPEQKDQVPRERFSIRFMVFSRAEAGVQGGWRRSGAACNQVRTHLVQHSLHILLGERKRSLRRRVRQRSCSRSLTEGRDDHHRGWTAAARALRAGTERECIHRPNEQEHRDPRNDGDRRRCPT